MGNKRAGNLFYDAEIGRYDIRFDLERFYGGLHCGECFEVSSGIDGVWLPTRIEYSDGWYLVDLKIRLDGLTVRI